MSTEIAYNLEKKQKVQGAEPTVRLEILIARKYADKAKNANDKGQDFNVPYQEFFDMVKTGTCHYTGKKITDLEKASIERVNPLKGYVAGNVCLVDAGVNTFKGATIDVFLRSRFGNSMPNCLAEILNICNKTALNMGLDVQFNGKTGYFNVYNEKALNAMENTRLLAEAKNHKNGFFGKRSIVRVESKRSKYYGKPAVILKTYSKDGVAISYKVKILTDGCPKVKVTQVSLMDLE